MLLESDSKNEKVYAVFLGLILLSLPISLKINAYLIGVFFMFFLFEGGLSDKIQRLMRSRLFLLILLYFAFLFGQMLYDDDPANLLKIIETKGALLIIPLIFIGKGLVLSPRLKEHLMQSFSLGMILLSLIALVFSLIQFMQDGDAQHFFYHALSEPFECGAIYFSLWILMAALSTFYLRLFNEKLRIAVLLYFILFVLLLASKTILISMVILMIMLAISRWKSKLAIVGTSGLLLIISLILSTSNPIRDRFSDLDSDRFAYLWQDELSTDIYLDGMSMRLLFAKFGFELINENSAWIQGVGAGSSLDYLDEKKRNYSLYQGVEGEENAGYMKYNFHNQYMEEWVGGGLIGLALFFALLLYLGKSLTRDLLGRQLLFVFMMLFLTESVLLRQYGVVSFSVFLFLQIRPSIEIPPQEILAPAL